MRALLLIPILIIPHTFLAQTSPPPPSSPQEITLHNPALEQFQKAQALFQSAQYAAALQEYVTLSRQYPSFSKIEEVLYRIAECYRLLDRPQDAIAAFKFALEKFPDGIYTTPIYLRLAQLLISTGKQAEAITTLKALKDKPTTSPETQHTIALTLAQAYLKQKQVDQAIPLLQELIDLPGSSPFKITALELLAEYNENNNQLQAALDLWQKIIALAPADPSTLGKAHARAAFVHWRLQNLSAALNSFKEALQLLSGSKAEPLIRSALIQLYVDLKQPTEAIALYLPHRDQIPESMLPDVLKKVAQAYIEIESPSDAITILDILLQKFPDHPIAPAAAYERLRARSQLNPDSIDEDTAAFLIKYGVSPIAYTVRYLRATHFQQKKQYAKAIPLWEQLALEKNNLPKNLHLPTILLQLGEAHLRTERYDSAATTLQEYLDLSPDLPDPLPILQHIALAWQKASRPTQAITAWKRIMESTPATSALHLNALEQLASLYSTTKQEKEKIAILTRIYADHPTSTLRPTAAFILAQEAIKEKQYPHATALLEEARQLDPKTWDGRATYQLLALAQHSNDLVAAIKHLSHYTALRKENSDLPAVLPATYYWMGDAAYQQKDYANAKKFLDQFLTTATKEDEIAATSWLLAKINIELQSWRDALVHLERFSRLRPDQTRTSEYLLAQLRTFYHTANFDRAEAAAEQILRQEPEGEFNLQARYWIAEIFFARRQYQEAARAFASLSYLHSDNILTPLAMHRAAIAFEKSGDIKAAAEWRLRLRSRYPDYKPINP